MNRLIVSTSTSALKYYGLPSNVRSLNMQLEVYGKMYVDEVNLSYMQLVDMMEKDPKLSPKTAPTTLEDIQDFFYHLMQAGYDEILVVCISSRLSNTYQYVCDIRDLFASKITIYPFDTRSLAYGEAVMVMEASRMLEEGFSMPMIIQTLEKIRDNKVEFFVIEDFRNMVHTKRLSATTAFVANLFGINQIVELSHEGEAVPYEKVRGTQKAITRLCDIMFEKVNQRQGHMYLMGFNIEEYANYALELLASHGWKNLPVRPFSSTTIANLGSRGMGIGVILDNPHIPKRVYSGLPLKS